MIAAFDVHYFGDDDASAGAVRSSGIEVLRGRNKRPLYVTSTGIDPHLASEKIKAMHGAHRVPTLLRRVDLLARQGAR